MVVRVVASAVAAASVAGSALFAGPGVAGANPPDVVNRTYQDAKRIIQRSGGKAVVATRTGNALAESRCLVTNAWE
ncbi:hypothetical protein ABQE42_19515, partial [Mycolicibacterium pulveris]